MVLNFFAGQAYVNRPPCIDYTAAAGLGERGRRLNTITPTESRRIAMFSVRVTVLNVGRNNAGTVEANVMTEIRIASTIPQRFFSHKPTIASAPSAIIVQRMILVRIRKTRVRPEFESKARP